MSVFDKIPGVFFAVGLALLAGCSNADDPGLKQRIAELEAENQQLKKRVEKLSNELRPLRAKVDRLDQGQQNLETTLAQVDEDIRSRLTDLVQQAVRGGRFRRAPRPEPDVRFEVRPYMGFDGQNITADLAKHLNLKATAGVLVTDVREGSPAAVAGLKKNDVVQKFDDTEIKTRQDLERAVKDKKPGETVTMALMRGEEKVELKVKLGVTKVRVED